MKGTEGGVTTVSVGNYFEWTGSTATMKKYYYAGAVRLAVRTGTGTGTNGLSWLLFTLSIVVRGCSGRSAQKLLPNFRRTRSPPAPPLLFNRSPHPAQPFRFSAKSMNQKANIARK